MVNVTANQALVVDNVTNACPRFTETLKINVLVSFLAKYWLKLRFIFTRMRM